MPEILLMLKLGRLFTRKYPVCGDNRVPVSVRANAIESLIALISGAMFLTRLRPEKASSYENGWGAVTRVELRGFARQISRGFTRTHVNWQRT